MGKPSSRQIGKCGELLVQYKLLKHGIESSPLTTDAGIDLVAYNNVTQKAVTIQVKTAHPHHITGGHRVIGWSLRDDCPAEYIAAVDLDREKFWLISYEEFKGRAQQHHGGLHHLWWFTPEQPEGLPPPKTKKSWSEKDDFARYKDDEAIQRVFRLK